MLPPLKGAPAPLLEAVVLIVWLADPLVGLQSTTVMLVLALAGTAAMVSIVNCDTVVALLSFLLRLSLAIAVIISAIPAVRPVKSTSPAISISISVNPASRFRAGPRLILDSCVT
jgi:hypothetical protein